MTIVAFDQTAFLSRHPEFKKTVVADSNSAINSFNMACTLLDNTDASRVPEPPRGNLLDLLTAHVMSMFYGVDGKKPARLVGRIASAGEGSVNVSLDMGPPSAHRAWYNQTIYGAMYYQASLGYRSAMYISPTPAPVAITVREG